MGDVNLPRDEPQQPQETARRVRFAPLTGRCESCGAWIEEGHDRCGYWPRCAFRAPAPRKAAA